MKVLKIIIGVLLMVIVLGFGYLAMLPSNYTIERTVTINAPKGVVMQHIANYSEWDHWSPWKSKDPDAKYTYAGDDGAIGSTMSWVTSLPPEDTNQIGVGGMTLSSLAGDQVVFELSFSKPWEMTSTNGFDLSEENNVTTVRWYDTGELSFFSRPVGKMMDQMVGPDFEKGLAKLKSHVEEHAANMKTNFIVEQVQVKGLASYSIMDSIKRANLAKAKANMLSELKAFTEEKSIEITGSPFTVYYTWDSLTTKIVYGIPVANNAKMGKGLIMKGDTYAGDALKTTLLGSYENGEEPHNAIAEYAQENDIAITGVPWEVYLVGPSNEEDATKWVTEIYYPIN